MVYLRYYCTKLKHRPYHEIKSVITKHFLRLGVYLDPSVFELIIFFHSLDTTLMDSEGMNINHCRQRVMMALYM
jgi:hypothetical protein